MSRTGDDEAALKRLEEADKELVEAIRRAAEAEAEANRQQAREQSP